MKVVLGGFSEPPLNVTQSGYGASLFDRRHAELASPTVRQQLFE